MSSEDVPLPPVIERRPLVELWSAPLVRVHDFQFEAIEFNPGRGAGGRFDPLRDRCGSIVATLIQLRGFGLGRVGLRRRHLIDTNADQYAATRAWAAALYEASPTADGMIWMSRQHDVSEAMILFGTRVGRQDLEVTVEPQPLATADAVDDRVLIAAEAAGITIVLPL